MEHSAETLDKLFMVFMLMALAYLENLRSFFKIKCCLKLVIWIKLGFGWGLFCFVFFFFLYF